jgi:exopolysaccharide biosynthesis protein
VPGQVRSITDWLTSLPGAAAIVNANYFDTSNNPLGLVAVNGAQYGSLLPRSDAGLFQVVNGVPKVRSLFLEPYGPGEHFEQVLQGYPMLMVMGQPAPAFDRTLNNVLASRTVIAQDVHGRILLMVTSPGLASFTDMARWLAVSGLEIDAALNLDGGQSTAMYLATGGPSSITPGIRPVPVVLAVYPR